MKTTSRTLQTTLLGALGGFLGFLLSEFLAPDRSGGGLWATVLHTAWWTALLVLPLTALLVVAENTLGMRGRWSRGLGRVLLPAMLIGALSGAAAQFFYGLSQDIGAPQRLMRALGWALMGAGVGLLLGLNDRSVVKALRGLLGGAVGGFVGGLLFDSFAGLRLGAADNGTLARLMGLTILGAAIGFMLRLSQELLKDAWLICTTTGRYEGKQYILGKRAVTVGRSDGNDISLYHDAAAPMQAGTLRRDGQGWRWEGEAVPINGQPQSRAALRPGDRLTIGQTELLFQQRGKAGAPGTPTRYTQPLALLAQNDVALFPTTFEHVTLGTQGEVRVSAPDVLPRHAEITAQDGRLTLQAHGALRVNGQPVAAGSTATVRLGDRLSIGGTEYELIKAELRPVKD